MIADKVVYCLNSAAVGDLIAAIPTIKYAIKNFHKTCDYRIGIYEDFKCLFPFVPEDKFVGVSTKYDSGFTIRYLNPPGVGGAVCRITPSRLKLTQYASINLLGRVLTDYELAYEELPDVDISRYNHNFNNSAIIITTYRDKQRTILPEELLKISEYIQSKGVTPVFVGKTGAISIWKNNLAKSDFDYPGFGLDLRNDTTFLELSSIMKQSKVVIGMDSGPIHLAFTTKTPVICGFTTILPELRIPYRGLAQTESVVPNIWCNFCESNWSLNSWNFNNCPRKMELAECVTKITADKFIKSLNKFGI